MYIELFVFKTAARWIHSDFKFVSFVRFIFLFFVYFIIIFILCLGFVFFFLFFCFESRINSKNYVTTENGKHFPNFLWLNNNMQHTQYPHIQLQILHTHICTYVSTCTYVRASITRAWGMLGWLRMIWGITYKNQIVLRCFSNNAETNWSLA